jgi:hypothetical protein
MESIIFIWSNHGDNDYVLIIVIDVNSQTGKRSRQALLFDSSEKPEALDLHLRCGWTVAAI